MRWGGLAITLVLAACASTPRPPIASVTPPVDVIAVPAPEPIPDETATKAKADEAVTLAASMLQDIGRTCGQEWLETEVACPASAFVGFATDYQAYYGEHGDPASLVPTSYYALPRLGGSARTVEQVTNDLVMGCEDGCRTLRSSAISSAVDEAVASCEKTKTGFASCRELEKRLAKNVRASEVTRWTRTCEGRCDGSRERAILEARREAKRPKTAAASEACKSACRKVHTDPFCGTPLMSCLADCTMR